MIHSKIKIKNRFDKKFPESSEPAKYYRIINTKKTVGDKLVIPFLGQTVSNFSEKD